MSTPSQENTKRIFDALNLPRKIPLTKEKKKKLREMHEELAAAAANILAPRNTDDLMPAVMATPNAVPPTTTDGNENKVKGKPKRGRRMDTNRDEDKRIYDGWKESGCRSFEEYATVCRRSKREIQKAIDRHKKRSQRAKDK